MSSTFWTTVESIEALSSMARLNEWKTYKQMLDRYGETELKVLIADGSLLVRPNPLNPKLKLYLDRTDSMGITLSKGSKWSATGSSKTNKEQHQSLLDAMKSTDVSEDMLDKLHSGFYGTDEIDPLATKLEQDQQEDKLDVQTVASLPPALKRRLKANPSNTEETEHKEQDKDKKDLWEKVIEEVKKEQAVDWKKVTKVQVLLTKGRQSINTLLFSIKGQGFQPDKSTKSACQQAVEDLGELDKKLDLCICQKKASKKTVISLLQEAAKLYKQGQEMHSLLLAFSKSKKSS